MNALAERLPPFMRRMDPAVVTAFACILLLLFLGSLYSSNFLSPEYLLQQLKVASFLGIIATGMMLVILLGQIDLSLPWVVSVGAMMSRPVAGLGDVGAAIAIPFGIFFGFLIGLVLIIALSIMKVKGAILISIIATTLIGIPFGVTKPGDSIGFAEAAGELSVTFGTIFTAEGLPSLFTDMSKLPLVLMTIFAFSLTDTFDTIGTFIGTGRRSGIFSEEDEKAMEDSRGFSSRMDKALFADAIATSVGAVVGTSNTTTYVESAAGIQAGGRSWAQSP